MRRESKSWRTSQEDLSKWPTSVQKNFQHCCTLKTQRDPTASSSTWVQLIGLTASRGGKALEQLELLSRYWWEHTFVRLLWKIGVVCEAEHVRPHTQKLSSGSIPNRSECLWPPKAIYKNDCTSSVLNNWNWKPATGSLTVDWKHALRYNSVGWHIPAGKGDWLHAALWMNLADKI